MKTILITGASGGIGLAIAKEFAKFPDFRLLLQYHNADPGFAAGLRGSTAIRCDIRDEAGVKALFDTAPQGVDVLINCHGVSDTALFDTIGLAAWNDMLAVNLTGAFLTCRAAVPAMVRKKEGSIVNIASIWGQVGASCEAHYSAAKGGLIAMTKALAKELAPSGIRVNCLSPGYIETPMNARLSNAEKAAFFAEIPLGRAGTPEEVAAAARFLALDATYMTGQVLSVNGGLT